MIIPESFSKTIEDHKQSGSNEVWSRRREKKRNLINKIKVNT